MHLTQKELLNEFHYEDGKVFKKLKSPKSIRKYGSNLIEVGTEKDGRCRIGFKSKKFYRNVIVAIMHGHEEANYLDVDHIDQDKLNDKIENLRIGTRSENCSNKNVKPGKLGYRGVKQSQRGNPYATIKVGQEHIYLGSNESLEECAIAYNVAAINHFNKFATLNVIPGHHIWNSSKVTPEMIKYINNK